MMNDFEPEMPPENESPNSELHESRWSVISFDKREAQNLSYPEAEKKNAELSAQKVSGLCIITDEAAARMLNETKNLTD